MVSGMVEIKTDYIKEGLRVLAYNNVKFVVVPL